MATVLSVVLHLGPNFIVSEHAFVAMYNEAFHVLVDRMLASVVRHGEDDVGFSAKFAMRITK